MIRVKCAACGVTLDARDDLAGQIRNCPRCDRPIPIPETPTGDAQPTEELTPIIFANPAAERLPPKKFIDRLCRVNRYVICDKTMVLATWRSDGQGWMVRSPSGFIPARRDSDSLPHYGNFVLVELELTQTDEGLRLAAINSFQLATRFALSRLDKGDDDIVLSIVDYGCLNREQKFAVRQVLKEEFLREVWGDTPEIIDYLTNADYHSRTSRKGAKPETAGADKPGCDDGVEAGGEPKS
jgi:hypothetical protein